MPVVIIAYLAFTGALVERLVDESLRCKSSNARVCTARDGIQPQSDQAIRLPSVHTRILSGACGY